MQISMMKAKRVSLGWKKAWKVKKFYPLVLNEKKGLDELFVTCLNENSESKIKPIKNYLILFINTILNHMSTRSCLISQPKTKLFQIVSNYLLPRIYCLSFSV